MTKLPTDLPSKTSSERAPRSKRPADPSEQEPTLREISRGLAIKIARYFGFRDFRAEVAERVIGVVIVGDLSKPADTDDTTTGSDYRIFTIDLSVAHGRQVIEGTQDMVVANLALVSLTAGATFSLHVGDRDPVDFGGIGLGIGAGLEMSPPEQTRLLVTNTAQAAAVAKLMISRGVRVSF